MVQTRMIPFTQVTPSLLFSRKIYEKIETWNPLKLKLGIKYGSGDLVQDAKGVREWGSGCDVVLRKRA